MGALEICAICVGILMIIGFGPIIAFFAYLINPSKIFIPTMEKGILYALDFDSGTSAVTYNFSAVFSLRNADTGGPVKAHLSVETWYGGQKLETYSNMTSLKVPSKDTTEVSVLTPGLMTVKADLPEVVGRTYTEDAARGYFIIETKLRLKSRWKLCKSSCILYFPMPTIPFPLPQFQPAANAVATLFDGRDCATKCKLKWGGN